MWVRCCLTIQKKKYLGAEQAQVKVIYNLALKFVNLRGPILVT